MNRSTRDRFVSSANVNWETPPAIFAQLDADFGPFDIDLTADAARALCPTWFGPGSPYLENALADNGAQWARYGRRGYSNPPYGRFVPHMLRAAARAARYHQFTTTLLLPMRATRAFRTFVLPEAAQLWFCDKRITFWEHGAPRLNPRTGKPDAALFDSIIVRFAPGNTHPLCVDVWTVPAHVAPREHRYFADAAASH